MSTKATGPRPGSIPFLSFTSLDLWDWALVGVMVLAVFVRFWGLGDMALFHDETYYWVWSQHIGVGDLELNFYDHPAGVAYLIAISTAFFGDSEFGVRAVFALLGVATVLAAYVLGRYLYDKRTGVIAAFLLAVNFGHILISRVALNDVAATFMFVVGIAFFAKAVLERSDKYLMLTGIVMGVGFLMKYTVAVLLLGMLVFVYAYPKYRKFVFSRSGVYALLFFAVFTIPFFAWNAMNGWAALSYQGAHASPFLGLFWGGTLWTNSMTSVFIYPLIWGLLISLPLTVLLVWGLFDVFKWRFDRGAAAVSALALICMFVAGGIGNEAIAFAFELVFVFSTYMCFRGFTSEQDGLLAIMSIVFIAFFAFSLGRMPHWTLPALAPMSILGARLLVRLYSTSTVTKAQLRTVACTTMLLMVWVGGYGVNSALSMTGESRPDPKSILGPALYPSIQHTRDIGDATCHYIDVYGRDDVVVLTPNWITYSPVAYYMHRNGYDNEMYTYSHDVQIGTVWHKDADNMPPYYTKAVVPVYMSSFLGEPDDEGIFAVLVYYNQNVESEFWFWSNDQTMYAQTGFDFYEVVDVPTFEYNYTYMFTKQTTKEQPYFVAYAEKRGTANVTIVNGDFVYWAPKDSLAFEGKEGSHRLDVFKVMSRERYNATFGGYDG